MSVERPALSLRAPGATLSTTTRHDSARWGRDGELDERADAALTLARELQDSARRSRETVRQLREYLDARGTRQPPLSPAG